MKVAVLIVALVCTSPAWAQTTGRGTVMAPFTSGYCPAAGCQRPQEVAFCKRVVAHFVRDGSPQGNQQDWVSSNYFHRFGEAMTCVDAYLDRVTR